MELVGASRDSTGCGAMEDGFISSGRRNLRLPLRFARKVGNPLQTDKGSRPSCRNQERRRGSDDVVPGTSVFPLSESGMSRASLGGEDSPGERNDNPLRYSCLGNPMDRGAWWASHKESDTT